MDRMLTADACFRIVRSSDASEEFKKFYQEVQNALMTIINSQSTAYLYSLTDKLFTKTEFDTALDSMGIISAIDELSECLPTHANCALYPDVPNEQSLHDAVISPMPFVFYFIKKVYNADDDTTRSELTKQIIMFQYTRLKNRYVIVSQFTPPVLL